MTVRTVAIAHSKAMVAEGIAAALAAYPEIVPIAATTSTVEVERRGGRADAVALDLGLPGARTAAWRLRLKGVRVVFIEDGSAELDDDDEDGPVIVPEAAPISALAVALVPGLPHRPADLALSRREQEVLSLVARGFAAKQVARHLGISPKTVERHKTRIYSKLRVPNQAAAVSATLGRIHRSVTWNLSIT